jgi:hypothetical protein
VESAILSSVFFCSFFLFFILNPDTSTIILLKTNPLPKGALRIDLFIDQIIDISDRKPVIFKDQLEQ